MTKEVYKKAKELNEDLYSISACLREVKEENHWITFVTPNKKEVYISLRLQDELVEWLTQKKIEYELEFAMI